MDQYNYTVHTKERDTETGIFKSPAKLNLDITTDNHQLLGNKVLPDVAGACKPPPPSFRLYLVLRTLNTVFLLQYI